MEVDLSKLLLDYEGDAIEVMERKNGVDVVMTKKAGDKDVPVVWTLGRICVNALSAATESDRNLNPDDVVKRWKLAMAMHGCDGAFTLEPEQATLLRERIAKQYPILLAGQACELLKG